MTSRRAGTQLTTLVEAKASKFENRKKMLRSNAAAAPSQAHAHEEEESESSASMTGPRLTEDPNDIREEGMTMMSDLYRTSIRGQLRNTREVMESLEDFYDLFPGRPGRVPRNYDDEEEEYSAGSGSVPNKVLVDGSFHSAIKKTNSSGASVGEGVSVATSTESSAPAGNPLLDDDGAAAAVIEIHPDFPSAFEKLFDDGTFAAWIQPLQHSPETGIVHYTSQQDYYHELCRDYKAGFVCKVTDIDMIVPPDVVKYTVHATNDRDTEVTFTDICYINSSGLIHRIERYSTLFHLNLLQQNLKSYFSLFAGEKLTVVPNIWYKHFDACFDKSQLKVAKRPAGVTSKDSKRATQQQKRQLSKMTLSAAVENEHNKQQLQQLQQQQQQDGKLDELNIRIEQDRLNNNKIRASQTSIKVASDEDEVLGYDDLFASVCRLFENGARIKVLKMGVHPVGLEYLLECGNGQRIFHAKAVATVEHGRIVRITPQKTASPDQSPVDAHAGMVVTQQQQNNNNSKKNAKSKRGGRRNDRTDKVKKLDLLIDSCLDTSGEETPGIFMLPDIMSPVQSIYNVKHFFSFFQGTRKMFHATDDEEFANVFDQTFDRSVVSVGTPLSELYVGGRKLTAAQDQERVMIYHEIYQEYVNYYIQLKGFAANVLEIGRVTPRIIGYCVQFYNGEMDVTMRCTAHVYQGKIVRVERHGPPHYNIVPLIKNFRLYFNLFRKSLNQGNTSSSTSKSAKKQNAKEAAAAAAAKKPLPQDLDKYFDAVFDKSLVIVAPPPPGSKSHTESNGHNELNADDHHSVTSSSHNTYNSASVVNQDEKKEEQALVHAAPAEKVIMNRDDFHASTVVFLRKGGTVDIVKLQRHPRGLEYELRFSMTLFNEEGMAKSTSTNTFRSVGVVEGGKIVRVEALDNVAEDYYIKLLTMKRMWKGRKWQMTRDEYVGHAT